jgi:hypothetical protein
MDWLYWAMFFAVTLAALLFAVLRDGRVRLEETRRESPQSRDAVDHLATGDSIDRRAAAAEPRAEVDGPDADEAEVAAEVDRAEVDAVEVDAADPARDVAEHEAPATDGGPESEGERNT